jgi:hypothetical protein
LAGVRTLVTRVGGFLGFHFVECLHGGGADLAVARRADYDLTRSTTPSHLSVDARPEVPSRSLTCPGLRASWTGRRSTPRGQPRRLFDTSRAVAFFRLCARTPLRASLAGTVPCFREHAGVHAF